MKRGKKNIRYSTRIQFTYQMIYRLDLFQQHHKKDYDDSSFYILVNLINFIRYHRYNRFLYPFL
ncbi:unnamed protein product [Heterobilharzia americana]|nr:unnamed protein product [Heterobilharzia americana]CAH8645204.1 unnamed protein product [Heterobilharzia americana]